MPWTTDFEEGAPPGAPARDVVDELYAMVEGGWLMAATVEQLLNVYRPVCEGYGWYWPMVAKLLRRGVGGGPPNRLTPSQRSQQAKIAADRSWAYTVIPAERTNAARSVFLGRFEREVDPDGVLPPGERARRAHYARRAYFRGLGLRSSLARQARRIHGDDPGEAPEG